MKGKVVLVLKIVFLVLIVAWVGIVVIDYFNARNLKDSSFCLKEVVHIYNTNGELTKTMSKDEFEQLSSSEKDNTLYTSVCTGLGYKVYRYHREFNAIEFGPFFIEERQSAN